MTREEAINQLEINKKDDTYVIDDKALDMAIKALQEEPCEDCVSRKSLKHKLQERHDLFVDAYGGFINLPQKDKARVDAIATCIAMVVNEPPVKPTRKKGKWIATTEISTNKRGQIVHEVICSECNGISYFRGMDGKYIGANLCPNCGAEMENEE